MGLGGLDDLHGLPDIIRLATDQHVEFLVDQEGKPLAEQGMVLDNDDFGFGMV
jgi:hypothetical protein